MQHYGIHVANKYLLVLYLFAEVPSEFVLINDAQIYILIQFCD